MANHKSGSCDSCGRTFTDTRALQLHMAQAKFPCKSCPLLACLRPGQWEHARTEHGLFACRRCFEMFDGAESLRSHVEEKHARLKPFSCRVCGAAFSDRCMLDKHAATAHFANARHACTVCGKTYASSVALSRHSLYHAEQKPFVCDVCSKGFPFKKDLQQHLLRHATEKPFECLLCHPLTRYYATRTLLNQHERAAHLQLPKLQCSLCPKRFHVPSRLKRHQIGVHGVGQKPYACSLCPKRCISSSKLQTHERTHTGEKPYACAVCGKAFANLTHLERHQVVHTGEKNFQCEACGKRFAQNAYLRIHRQSYCNTELRTAL